MLLVVFISSTYQIVTLDSNRHLAQETRLDILEKGEGGDRRHVQRKRMHVNELGTTLLAVWPDAACFQGAWNISDKVRHICHF